MKKRILTIILSFLLVLGLFGCDKKTNPTTTTKPGKGTESSVTVNNELKVKYYDGGELLYDETYTKDNFSLKEVTKSDYEFKGWFLDQALTQAFDNSKLDEYFKNKSIILYAKWEEVMNGIIVETRGMVENKTVVNPIFVWNNPENDTKFNVKIYTSTGLEEQADVTETTYICPLLSYDTQYRIVIEGKDSHKVKEVKFTTIPNNNYNLKRQITVCDPFMDNMVIQRDEEIVIKGVGPQRVLMTLNFGDDLYYMVTDEEGNFDFTIPGRSASFDPIKIVVGQRFSKRVTINNVLIGDVFFFTGQSNMQWGVRNSDYEEEDATKALQSDVRFFSQGVVTSNEPLEHVSNGKWFSVSGDNYKGYSALAFMGGAFLGDALKTSRVPVGILSAYQGDTNIANWMGADYYTGTSKTKNLHYNAMVYPLRAAKIKGVVWYQGCNNSAAGGDYENFLMQYFRNYRDLFNNQDLSFYVIGLACYDGDSGNNFDFSYVRESQAKACARDDKAYYISSCDDGDPTFIHPTHKRYIALRIAKSILSSLYGFDYLSEGPSYKSHTVSGRVVTVEVNNGEGLYATGEIDDFYLAGSDGKYYKAQATIDNGKIVVESAKVSDPKYIKYGFGKSPFTNIFNKDDFSMVPFRTDDRGLNIDLLEYDDLSKYKVDSEKDNVNISLFNDGILFTKSDGSAKVSRIILEKWGMIAYDAVGFKFNVIGTGDNSTITFKLVEGNSTLEEWGYTIVNNFDGIKEINMTIDDFVLLKNKGDGILNTQAVKQIEIWIERNGGSNFTIKEARFIQIDRTKPRDFKINSAVVKNQEATVLLNKATFANSYKVLVSNNKDDFSNPLINLTSETTSFKFSVANFETNTPYYIRAIAVNEIGETICINDALMFLVPDENKYILGNFDFDSQAELDSFVGANMSIKDTLHYELDNHKIKVTTSGDSWAYFIFNLDQNAASGKTKLRIVGDFSNFSGESIVLQFADPSNNTYSYTMDFSSKTSGEFIIDLTDFKKGDVAYSSATLSRLLINFKNVNSTSVVLFDEVELIK